MSWWVRIHSHPHVYSYRYRSSARSPTPHHRGLLVDIPGDMSSCMNICMAFEESLSWSPWIWSVLPWIAERERERGKERKRNLRDHTVDNTHMNGNQTHKSHYTQFVCTFWESFGSTIQNITDETNIMWIYCSGHSSPMWRTIAIVHIV